MKRDKKLDNLIKSEIRADDNSEFFEYLLKEQSESNRKQLSEKTQDDVRHKDMPKKKLAIAISAITAMVLLCVIVTLVVLPVHETIDDSGNVLLSNLNKEMYSYEFVESEEYNMVINSIEHSEDNRLIGYKVFYINDSETEQLAVRTYFKEKTTVPNIPQYRYNGSMMIGAYEFVYAEQFIPERDDFFVIHVNGYIDTPFERVFIDYGYNNSVREHHCFDLLNALLRQK